MARARDAFGKFVKGSSSSRGVVDIDKGWKKIVKYVGDGMRSARVGVQGDAAQFQVEGSEFTVADLAVIHEFGVPEVGIPERSFIRSTFDEHQQQYSGMLAKGGAQILGGKMTQDQVVGIIGEKMVGDIKEKINAGIPPENAQSTKDAKGSSTPLIDTGHMKQSITSVVKNTNRSKRVKA